MNKSKSPAEALAEQLATASPTATRNSRLRDKRVALSLTLSDVYSGTGVPASTLSQYENDGKQPSMRNARALAYFFGTTIDDLFPWDPEDIARDISTRLGNVPTGNPIQ